MVNTCIYMYLLPVYTLHYPTGLHLTKLIFRDKFSKNFKMVTAEHESKHGALVSARPCATALVGHL